MSACKYFFKNTYHIYTSALRIRRVHRLHLHELCKLSVKRAAVRFTAAFIRGGGAWPAFNTFRPSSITSCNCFGRSLGERGGPARFLFFAHSECECNILIAFLPAVMHAGAKNSRLRVLLRVAISNLINSKHTACYGKCNENRARNKCRWQ